MCFNITFDAYKKGEVIMIEGGFCRFHLRRDGQLTIHEIFSNKPGSGKKLLSILMEKDFKFIIAKCPSYLESNKWYEKNGFYLLAQEKTNNGMLNVWKKEA